MVRPHNSFSKYHTEEKFGDQNVLQIYKCGILAKNSLANQ